MPTIQVTISEKAIAKIEASAFPGDDAITYFGDILEAISNGETEVTID